MLTVVDEYTRECLTLYADTASSGEKVAAAMDKNIASPGASRAGKSLRAPILAGFSNLSAIEIVYQSNEDLAPQIQWEYEL